MIKHGFSPTAGEFTGTSSYVDPLSNRDERCDYKTDDELTLEALDLLMSADVPLNGLFLATNNSVLTIKGKVPSRKAKREIETLLRSMRGLIDLYEELEVDATLKAEEKVEHH